MFYGYRLKEIREARGYSQSYLADRIGVSTSAISSFENGFKMPSSDTLLHLASALVAPYHFFQKDRPKKDPRTSVLTYRPPVRTALKSLHQIQALEQWLSDIQTLFSQKITWPQANILKLEKSFQDISLEDVEEYAQEQHRLWGMSDGPISNLGIFLENNGVIWSRHYLLTMVDGVSNWRCQNAFVMINDKACAYRDRFNLAHELGHLILHRELTEEQILDKNTYQLIEDQAHRFAGAFLFPAKSFATEVRYLKFDYLLGVKERWKISCQALVSRGSQLGLFNSDQVQYFYFNLIKRTGSRKKEPGDDKLVKESPSLFSEACSVLGPGTLQQIFDDSGLSSQDFCSLTEIEPSLLLGNNKTISFKAFLTKYT